MTRLNAGEMIDRSRPCDRSLRCFEVEEADCRRRVPSAKASSGPRRANGPTAPTRPIRTFTMRGLWRKWPNAASRPSDAPFGRSPGGGSELQSSSAGRADLGGNRQETVALKTPQQRIEARRLVFLEEAWINTNMAPRWAWGRRLCATVPHEHWKIVTFIAALRPDLVHRCPTVSSLPSILRGSSSPPTPRGTSLSWTISAAIRAKPSIVVRAAGAHLNKPQLCDRRSLQIRAVWRYSVFASSPILQSDNPLLQKWFLGLLGRFPLLLRSSG